MRTPFIAGNWKMNTDRASARALAEAIAQADLKDGVEVALCPPALYLAEVVAADEGACEDFFGVEVEEAVAAGLEGGRGGEDAVVGEVGGFG